MRSFSPSLSGSFRFLLFCNNKKVFEMKNENDPVTIGVFTLPDTDTDKMGLQPNCICVGVCVCISVGQYEHFHTILYNPSFIGVGVEQCEHTICVLLIYTRKLQFHILLVILVQVHDAWFLQSF